MNQIINKMPPAQSSPQLLVRPTEISAETQRFLGLTIGDSLNALIPLVDLQATIKISLAEILPVPQMNDSLLGIINYSGKATWVVDLAHLMGGSCYLSTPKATTGMGLLFQVENETVALLIDRVGTIEIYDLDQCLPIGETMFTEQVRLFLSGYFIDAAKQSRVVVDLQQVIRFSKREASSANNY
jgi:positive phototaxis protein PixI